MLRATALAGRRSGVVAVAGISQGLVVRAVGSALGIPPVVAAGRLALLQGGIAGVATLGDPGIRPWRSASHSASSPKAVPYLRVGVAKPQDVPSVTRTAASQGRR